jgi:hypothetical protein
VSAFLGERGLAETFSFQFVLHNQLLKLESSRKELQHYEE